MEVVRKYMDAESLLSIMALPEDFKNRRVEVIILPVEETEKRIKNLLTLNGQLKNWPEQYPIQTCHWKNFGKKG